MFLHTLSLVDLKNDYNQVTKQTLSIITTDCNIHFVSPTTYQMGHSALLCDNMKTHLLSNDCTSSPSILGTGKIVVVLKSSGSFSVTK
jgi:hypothetical protein